MMGNHHNEYVFEVELLAVVRVRAASESGAREVTQPLSKHWAPSDQACQ